jgi:hypothetical protein
MSFQRTYGKASATRSKFSTIWDDAIDVIKSSPMGKRLSLFLPSTQPESAADHILDSPISKRSVLNNVNDARLNSLETHTDRQTESEEKTDHRLSSPSSISSAVTSSSISHHPSPIYIDSSSLLGSEVSSLVSHCSVGSNAQGSDPLLQLIASSTSGDTISFADFDRKFGNAISFAKLGEASFSEVFAFTIEGSCRVLKIIPVAQNVNDLCSSVADVLQEVHIAKTLSTCSGYITITGYVRCNLSNLTNCKYIHHRGCIFSPFA